MAWKVGSVHEQSDFIGFNIIDATTQRPIVSFSYSTRDGATNGPDDAAKRVNLTGHAKDFPQITGPGADIRGVRRMYTWLDEKRAGR